MKKVKATFHNDGGHGWLAVKRSLLKELGIFNEVSSCSYQKGSTVYLEEDCDVSLLAEALRKQKGILKLEDFFEIKSSYKDVSPVRSYGVFNPNKVEKFTQGLRIDVYGKAYIVESVGKKVIVQDMDGKRYNLRGQAKEDATLA